MHDDIKEILITKEEIDQKCAEIGQQLTKEYEGKFPLAIGVLKGAVPFMADVLRYTETHLEIDFMDVSSYGSGDRKSTRLNSSHVSISYAVFCLKKKKSENSYYLSYNYILFISYS